jgi:hypothetical protein
MQNELARSQVSIDIKGNDAKARKAEADGEAEYIGKTGAAHGARVRAVGMARADAYKAQVAALGRTPTAMVNVASALADSGNKFVPEVLVAGGNASSLDGLASILARHFLEPGSAGSEDAAGTTAEATDKEEVGSAVQSDGESADV